MLHLFLYTYIFCIDVSFWLSDWCVRELYFMLSRNGSLQLKCTGIKHKTYFQAFLTIGTFTLFNALGVTENFQIFTYASSSGALIRGCLIIKKEFYFHIRNLLYETLNHLSLAHEPTDVHWSCPYVNKTSMQTSSSCVFIFLINLGTSECASLKYFVVKGSIREGR